ncbi:MAG: heavy metal translocating P-type ATPase [Hyphomicrobiales bacterium]
MNSAHIRFDAQQTSTGDLAKAVREPGYRAPGRKLSFDIDGMNCTSCAIRVEKALAELPGVTEASVNFALERADISVIPGQVDDASVIAAVKKTGYRATAHGRRGAAAGGRDNEAGIGHGKRDKSLLWLGASIILTLPLLAQMVWMYSGFEYRLPAWVELALATPVQFIIGYRFYRGAWKAIKNAGANMDVLVALGTSAAFFLSLYNMVFVSGGEAHLYFETSATIVTLILAGKIMEERAKRGTSAAIRELMALRPRRARKLDPGEGETEVDISELSIGDSVRVLPGERMPVDGRITAGESELDESLMTGETRPAPRFAGDKVVGGALNGSGRLDVEVTAIGENTTLSRIIRLVEQAQTGKAPVQRLVDKVSGFFVPTIIVIALVTFTGWFMNGSGLEASIIAAISVLVIACPCSLGLATPTALVAGTGAAARSGILIRNFEALEQAHNVDTVIFDKTGTLSEGTPTVRDISPSNDLDASELLRLTACVQAASEHPLAGAIVKLARERKISISDITGFSSKTGAGVTASVEGRMIAIGSEAMMKEHNITLPETGLARDIARYESKGQTVILVAIDGVFAGFITFEDRIRGSARQAIADLKKRGIDSIMLSGDSEEVSAHVAGHLGLEHFMGRVHPRDKAQEVEKLRKNGRHVAMVGDGINDAPALAMADVGIAMGDGTDVAMETADVTLMRSDPERVVAAIDVSIATRRKIAQNLIWAFAYNLVGVPLAAFGIVSPVIAGAAMALSSVSVVGNSLMLRRWKAWEDQTG